MCSVLDQLYDAVKNMKDEHDWRGLIVSNIPTLRQVDEGALFTWVLRKLIETDNDPSVIHFAHLITTCPSAPQEEDLRPFISNLVKVAQAASVDKAAQALQPQFMRLPGPQRQILTLMINEIYKLDVEQAFKDKLVTILIVIVHLK